MDSRLHIELGIDNEGNFFAIDHSKYETWIEEDHLDLNHVVYERIITYDGINAQVLASFKTVVTDIEHYNRCRMLDLPGDGLYLYQKLVLPVQGHAGDSICYSDVCNIYLITAEGTKIVDFDEAFDAVKECRTLNAFWFDDKVFSMFNLIKCYVIKIRNELNDYLKSNCAGACKTGGTSDADILLIAITVLKDLICKRDFFEAERILNALMKCGGLCKNLKTRTVSCGCD